MLDVSKLDLDNLFRAAQVDGKTVLVGVALSGGRDSVALLHLLKSAGVRVVALNVEHGIRGESSVRDSEFVRRLCEDWGVKLVSCSVDVPAYCAQNGCTIEQGARILRYEFFERQLAEGVCDLIALAHHADDQSETVLMRILRGTGVKGLAGMRPLTNRYIRPLLAVDREEIDEYIRRFGLPYVQDESNEDVRYTRNFLREEIASLKTRYPSLNDSIARLARNAAQMQEYVEQMLPPIAHEGNEAWVMLEDCRNDCQAKLLYCACVQALGEGQDLEDRHLALLLKFRQAQNGKRLQIGHDITAHKQQDRIVFVKEARQDRVCVPFDVAVCKSVGVEVECVQISCKEQGIVKGCLCVDADKIGGNVCLRNRREGDRFCAFGGASKSLGDFLTDKKIPLRKRDSLLLVARDSEVLVIIGVEISAKVAVDEHTKRVFIFK